MRSDFVHSMGFWRWQTSSEVFGGTEPNWNQGKLIATNVYSKNAISIKAAGGGHWDTGKGQPAVQL
jgi:hypothetical protein